MSVRSAAFGVLNGRSTVRNVSISEALNTNKHVASNTQLGAVRTNGIYEWSGTFENYGAQPLAMPRDTFSFQTYFAPDSGAVGGDGTIFSGTVIVDQVVINFNFESGVPGYQ